MGSPARSSMPSVLEWTLLVLAVLQIAGAQNCGDVKAEYKKQGCCNQPAQGFALNPFQDDYAFKLTDIPDTGQDGTGPDGWNWLQPEQTCFYPVSLEQFADGHRTYSWIPHDSPVMYLDQTCERSPTQQCAIIPSFATEAPNGAFVYKKSDGTFLYRKITRVAIDDPDATIIFRTPIKWTHQSTFQEVMDTADATDEELTDSRDYSRMELRHALYCFGASSVSLNNPPFNEYNNFVWTAGPFALAGKNGECGAFVYEKNDGSIVYHAC